MHILLCAGQLQLFLLVRAGQSPEVLIIVTAVSQTDSECTQGAEMLNKKCYFYLVFGAACLLPF